MQATIITVKLKLVVFQKKTEIKVSGGVTLVSAATFFFATVPKHEFQQLRTDSNLTGQSFALLHFVLYLLLTTWTD